MKVCRAGEIDLHGGPVFRMAFQPIVEIPTGRFRGFEALLRGPSCSPLSNPQMVFHEAGFNRGKLTRLDLSCIGSALLRARPLASEFTLFLNIHAGTIKVLHRAWDVFLGVLAELGISPEGIVFELSEGTDPASVSSIADAAGKFRASGIRIAIDDVRDNFRWLRHMLQLRPDFLKIGRPFTQDIRSLMWRRGILHGFSKMAVRMGVEVIAEGVESRAELDAVREVGIGLGQGFLFARPRPVEHWLCPGTAAGARRDGQG